jgi:hypothetical protein
MNRRLQINPIYLLALLLFLVSSPVRAQLWEIPDPLKTLNNRSGLQSAIGWTRIAVNDSGASINYATLSLYPEINIGKLHSGLAINLLINTKDDPGGSQVRQTDLKPGQIIIMILGFFISALLIASLWVMVLSFQDIPIKILTRAVVWGPG